MSLSRASYLSMSSRLEQMRMKQLASGQHLVTAEYTKMKDTDWEMIAQVFLSCNFSAHVAMCLDKL